MEEQIKQQFERLQNGFKPVFEAGPKMMEPALRCSEVAIDSLSQLAQDQFEFGRSCLDIGRRQVESLASSDGMTALLRDQSASSDYYNATLQYGEALRQNAERTRERMLAIGRETTDTFAGASARATRPASKKSADKSA